MEHVCYTEFIIFSFFCLVLAYGNITALVFFFLLLFSFFFFFNDVRKEEYDYMICIICREKYGQEVDWANWGKSQGKYIIKLNYLMYIRASQYSLLWLCFRRCLCSQTIVIFKMFLVQRDTVYISVLWKSIMVFQSPFSDYYEKQLCLGSTSSHPD